MSNRLRRNLLRTPARSGRLDVQVPAAAVLLLLGACGADSAPPLSTGTADPPPPAASGLEPGTRAAPTDAPKVVFLGDSLAAGLHLDPEDAFPAVLSRRLGAAGHPVQLVNAGISGDTTAGGLARIDWLLRQEPEVVVVELGGNDGLRGQPLESVESNLRGILERILAADATPLLLGMDVPTSYGAEYAAGFRALYRGLAEELGVAFVPAFLEGVGAVPEMNLPDGIHPTPEGHQRLADTVLPVLLPLVQAADETP